MPGRMMDLNPSSLPEVGSHPNITANTHIKISPMAKDGADCPINATTLPAQSKTESFLTATITPMGRAMAALITQANAASTMVLGSLRAISSVIGTPP